MQLPPAGHNLSETNLLNRLSRSYENPDAPPANYNSFSAGKPSTNYSDRLWQAGGIGNVRNIDLSTIGKTPIEQMPPSVFHRIANKMPGLAKNLGIRSLGAGLGIGLGYDLINRSLSRDYFPGLDSSDAAILRRFLNVPRVHGGDW